MRLAVLIIGLLLGLGLLLQSCAVALGGGIAEELSTSAADKAEGEDLAGGGAIGVFAAFLWLVACGFVMSKPKVSMIVLIVAGVFCLIGGSSGFSDLFIWAVVSFALAALSWRGIKEKETKEAEERERYQADVAAVAAATQQNNPPLQP